MIFGPGIGEADVGIIWRIPPEPARRLCKIDRDAPREASNAPRLRLCGRRLLPAPRQRFDDFALTGHADDLAAFG